MKPHRRLTPSNLLALGAIAIFAAWAPAHAQATGLQADVAAPVGTIVRTLHAVGAQIYECKADGRGGLAWMFREPIATLMSEGKTVGRHFAGPSWELADGSLVVGKVVTSSPGTSTGDIPWLRLEASEHRGSGVLDGVRTVQRIATSGGIKTGPCAPLGALAGEPYAADYVFSGP